MNTREKDINDFLYDLETACRGLNTLRWKITMYRKNTQGAPSILSGVTRKKEDTEEAVKTLIAQVKDYFDHYGDVYGAEAEIANQQGREASVRKVSHTIRTTDAETEAELRTQLAEQKERNEQLELCNTELHNKNVELSKQNGMLQTSTTEKQENKQGETQNTSTHSPFVTEAELASKLEANKAEFDYVADTLNILGTTFGLGGFDANSIEGKRFQLVANMIQQQRDTKDTIVKMQTEAETYKAQTIELKTQLKQLQNELAAVRADRDLQASNAQKLAYKIRRIKEKQSDKDRRVEERLVPILDEYEELKTTTGKLASGLGTMLGTLATSFLGNTSYAGLLGLDNSPKQNEQNDQAAKQEAQAKVQALKQTMDEQVTPRVSAYNDDEEDTDETDEEDDDIDENEILSQSNPMAQQQTMAQPQTPVSDIL